MAAVNALKMKSEPSAGAQLVEWASLFETYDKFIEAVRTCEALKEEQRTRILNVLSDLECSLFDGRPRFN
jgi:hypothetical protein